MQMDLVSYSGYKYVGLVVNLFVGIFGGQLAYYIVRSLRLHCVAMTAAELNYLHASICSRWYTRACAWRGSLLTRSSP
jgi:hypothetical protein